MFGALPLAFGAGDGAELRRPLGISIVGGLVFSQVLTLYSTPTVSCTWTACGSGWRDGVAERERANPPRRFQPACPTLPALLNTASASTVTHGFDRVLLVPPQSTQSLPRATLFDGL